MHFIISIIISAFAVVGLFLYGADRVDAVLAGFVGTIVVGVAKELYDANWGGTGFDEKDLNMDLLGAACGAVIGLVSIWV